MDVEIEGEDLSSGWGLTLFHVLLCSNQANLPRMKVRHGPSQEIWDWLLKLFSLYLYTMHEVYHTKLQLAFECHSFLPLKLRPWRKTRLNLAWSLWLSSPLCCKMCQAQKDRMSFEQNQCWSKLQYCGLTSYRIIKTTPMYFCWVDHVEWIMSKNLGKF